MKIRIVLIILCCLTASTGRSNTMPDRIGVARLLGRFVCLDEDNTSCDIPRSVVMTEDLFCDTLMAEITADGRFSFIKPLVRPMLCKLHLCGNMEYVYLEPDTDTRIEIPVSSDKGIVRQGIRQTGKYSGLADMWNKRSNAEAKSGYDTLNARIEEFLNHTGRQRVSYLDSLALILQDRRIQWCPAYPSLCRKLMDIRYLPPQYIADELKVRWLKRQLWEKYEYLDAQQENSAARLSPAYRQYVAVHSLHIPSRQKIAGRDTTVISYTHRMCPETVIRGQLKSRSKKAALNGRTITAITHYASRGISKSDMVTDAKGRFSLTLGNCSEEEDACISFSIKDKHARRYYITLEPYSHNNERTGLEAYISNTGCTQYNMDEIMDSIGNAGGRTPFLLDWLFRKDRNFQGGYGLLEPHSLSYMESDKLFDPEGPTYMSRPIIWIINDKFLTVTGKHSHNIAYRANNWTNEKITQMIDDVRTIYISLQDNIWRPWFLEDNLSGIKPATVLIYTYPKTISGTNTIRKIHIKTY